ncbi:MAG: DUF932 domain-containing protein [Leptolyngbyaceae bacterium]|nr:DUF932 domain-containing protein [Leptolyngbyaceae bacterium]
MSHELTIHKSGRVEMAYAAGEVPWHSLGTALPRDASPEEWLKVAGLDWKIQRSFVRFNDDDGVQHKSETDVVLFRNDTKAKLGIVSSDYKVVQPSQLMDVFADLAKNAGLKIETAGTLFGGKQFWVAAKVNDGAKVAGEDIVCPYVLMHSSCDGSSRTSARFTGIRPVCYNTVSAALGAAKATFAVSHRSKFSPEAAKAVLAAANVHFAAYVEAARALTKVRLTNSAAEQFYVKLLAEQLGTKEEKAVRESKAFKRILRLFTTSALGGTLLSAEGTAWGAVNAVTEYVDHDRSRSTLDHTVWNGWFGPGDKLKTAALTQALELV